MSTKFSLENSLVVVNVTTLLSSLLLLLLQVYDFWSTIIYSAAQKRKLLYCDRYFKV